MKILQVNCVYGEKSTGKLVQVLHQGALAAGHESWVAFGRGSGQEGEGVFRLCPEIYGKVNSLASRLTGLPYGGCWLSTNRLLRWIRREKPDVVHLQCINGNFVNIYRLVGWLNRRRIPTVLTLHAEFMHTANCGHAFECQGYLTGCGHCPRLRQATKSYFWDRTGASWKKMRRAFSGFGDRLRVVSVSGWLQQRAENAPILQPFAHETIWNGLDTKTFRWLGRRENQEKTVLHVTASFDDTPGHPKGGEYILALARRLPGVRFLVASGYQSLHGPVPANVELLGAVTDQEKLAELYARADLTVVTSQRETFSMPCAESLCCGTPVAGFRAGAPERVTLPDYSGFADFGDVDGLQAVMEEMLSKKWDREAIASQAAVAYSNETMTRAYLALYEKMRAEG